METEEKIYSVKIKGKERGFFLQTDTNGRMLLVVPDCGGQADMVPKYADQLEWLEQNLPQIKGLERIWNTVWHVQTKEALSALETFFKKSGKLSDKARIDFY